MRAAEGFENMEVKVIEGLNNENGISTSQRM